MGRRLEVRNLTVAYEGAAYAIRALDDVSFTVSDGELVLVLGPSGCGKTTLLSALAGLRAPTSGVITLDRTTVSGLNDDERVGFRRSSVGLVFKDLNLIPSLTALENVAIGLRVAGRPRAASKARAAELLTQVGLAERMSSRPADLTRGQQRRVAIARGLALDPPLLLADEPTADLDYIQVEGVLTLLRRLAAPGRIVIVASHDDRMVPLADRVIDLAPRPVSPVRPPRTMTLRPGEVVFRQGEKGELVYLVNSGTIQIVREFANAEQVLRVVGPGGYFGELSPTLGYPRSATARAAAPARVTGYSLHDFKQRVSAGRIVDLEPAAGSCRRAP